MVSGLARGIDAAAHQAALDAGGRTIAVMACGLDRIYPPKHRNLATAIAENVPGSAVTRWAPAPRGGAFPLATGSSAASLGVVVVEAGVKSGALITEGFALEQGREELAVPGAVVNQGSAVCNQLIHDGAKIVLGVEGILEELNLTMIALQAAVAADETEAGLIELVTDSAVHVDEICRRSQLPVQQISSTLAMMELKGMVRQVGGMHYVVAHDGGVPYRIG